MMTTFFTDVLKIYDYCSTENQVRRSVKAMEAGLCLQCGKTSGAPKGYTKMYCDECIEGLKRPWA